MKKVYLLLVLISLIFIGCQDNSDISESITASKAQVKPDIKAKGLDLLWNLDYPQGYLHTKDVSTGAIWGWTNNSAAYGNITAPIAYYLYKSSLKEPAIAGFEAMYARTSSDMNNFNSADLGVLLYAYRVTEDSKYLDLVNNMASNWIVKYTSDGSKIRNGLEGYDSMNWIRNAYYIKKTSGVDQSLLDWADESIITYETAQVNYTDPYNIVFTNVINRVYRYGTFKYLSLEDVIAAAHDDPQVLAYARIGDSTKKELYPQMEDALFNDNGEVSEVAAELIFALSK